MRPYVICHMCTTIDGRILVKRWGERLAQTQDGKSLFETTAASLGISAWIVGTHTMSEFSAKRRGRLAHATEPMPPGDFIANAGAAGFAIGADAKGVLRFEENEVEGDHIVVLVTRQVGDDYLAHLRAKHVSYLVCGSKTINLETALIKIRQHFKVRKLILEGGGTFNGAMLRAGLVDEISQVIVPAVDGGQGITGIFDMPGSRQKKIAATLRFTRHRLLPGGICWLRYRVRPAT